MTSGKFLFLALLGMAVLIMASPAFAQTEVARPGYILGPQDNLNIRVHTLRKNIGETYAWSALDGEVSVGADGYVSLPIVGELNAAGGTTAELAALISQTLQERADLAEAPSASVEVIRYRPYYVLGAVQQPGQYDFQPGIIVLQALSIAQGLVRADDIAGVEREIVTAGGDLRVLGAERVALLARIARLTAEISGADSVTFPPELIDNSDDPRVAAAMREETLRFTVRQTALVDEVETIERSKALLEEELQTLDVKGETLDRQLNASQEELRVVSNLVERGLAVSPRQVAAESAQTFIESNRLDVQVAVLRAQQSLARANRELVALPARQREDAIDAAASARDALNENVERLLTAERLLENASARSADLGDKAEAVAHFSITRNGPSGLVTQPATEGDALQPGDVLQVTLTSGAMSGSVAESRSGADTARSLAAGEAAN